MSRRYTHIEDVLIGLHEGQWFGWDLPSKSMYPEDVSQYKIYANLIIHNSDYNKPTEKSLTDALLKQQSDFDAQEYARNRATSYPSIGDQFDMLMKDMKNGTTTHQEACEAVKAKYPKP